MTHFAVETETLRDLAGRLKGIQAEFDALGDTVEGYEWAVGSEQLADRLGAFARNWSDKRKQISHLLEVTAGYAAAAADAYAQVDQELADGMETTVQGPPRR